MAFPDDDCWLPDGLLGSMEAVFAARPTLDLLICRVSMTPDDGPVSPDEVIEATTPHVVRMSSSNNMVLRGRLLPQMGLFDLELGLGTPREGRRGHRLRHPRLAEGAIRRLRAATLVGHPESDQASAAKYFPGALLVLSRHAWRKPSLMREFVRKLAVGAYFVARGRLTTPEYRTALKRAASTFVRADRQGRWA